ncbi:MAG: chemotaxis protein CheD [Oligoflexia bacterium]|nr:chemotaxis protein CheD [Oligoflexia bacterium]
MEKENNYITLQTGEVLIGYPNETLVSGPLGSCVAVIMYDTQKRYGGMAHIMLPYANNREEKDHRYAHDAILYLIELMNKQSESLEYVRVCLVGGANVLYDHDDSLCTNIISSVLKTLSENKLTIIKKSLGGFLRRQLILEVNSGKVFCSVGDDKEALFYQF